MHRTAEEAHAAAIACGAKCQQCPLYGLRQGPVMSVLPGDELLGGAETRLVVIGEGPGPNEVDAGAPFCGASGQVLNDAAELGGIARNEMALINVIACRPPGDYTVFKTDQRRAYRSQLIAAGVLEPAKKLNAKIKDTAKRIEKLKQPLLLLESRQALPGDIDQVALRKARKSLQTAEARHTALLASLAELNVPPPPLDPIDACRDRFRHDLAKVQHVSTVLALGGVAVEQFARVNDIPFNSKNRTDGRAVIASVGKQAGSPVKLHDGRTFCSSLHPALGLRKRQELRWIKKFIERAAVIATQNGEIDWVEPEFNIFPSVEDVEAFCQALIDGQQLEGGLLVTCDIETEGLDPILTRIRRIAFGAHFPGQPLESIMSVPLIWKNGRQVWEYSDRVRVENAIKRMLASCQLQFHNAPFDTSVMMYRGYMSMEPDRRPSQMRQFEDTIIASHVGSAGELRHKLGDIVRRHTNSPLWKDDVDHKTGDGEQDEETFGLYSARDILGTMRAGVPQAQEMHELGVYHTYQLDRLKSVIGREMTMLGLVIDERLRGQLLGQYAQACSRHEAKWRELTGGRNPGAPDQVGELLYSDWGYQPVLNDEGGEWQAGDKPTTRIAAIIGLIDSGTLRPEHEEACNALVLFKAAKTIYTRSLLKLPCRDYGDPTLHTAGMTPAVYGPDGTMLLPERPARTELHASWQVHSVCTGRWSTSPNVQNVTARALLVEDLEHQLPAGQVAIDPATGQPWRDRDGNTSRMAWHTKNKRPYPELYSPNLRAKYVAPPGHVFVGGDFSQIELRIYAEVANDKALKEAYANDKDAHWWNLAGLLCPAGQSVESYYDQLKHEAEHGSDERKSQLKFLRALAKRAVFGFIYNMEQDTLYSTLISERDKATMKPVYARRPGTRAQYLEDSLVESFYKGWHQKHPETKGMINAANMFYARNRFVESQLFGRRRLFLEGCDQMNALANTWIQPTASDIVDEATLNICEEIPFQSWSRWTGVCVVVHDQIVVMCPESRGEQAKEIMWRNMNRVFGGRFDIKAEVNITRDLAKQG